MAARRAGIGFGYVSMSETAKPCPSVAVAADLADALDLNARDRAALMAHAVHAGRSWRLNDAWRD